MNYTNYLTSALAAIRLNAMRSLLTALGVIIGVASVIVMSAIGSGARQEVERSISRLGTNMLTISPGSSRSGRSQGGAGTATPLSEEDMRSDPRAHRWRCRCNRQPVHHGSDHLRQSQLDDVRDRNQRVLFFCARLGGH